MAKHTNKLWSKTKNHVGLIHLTGQNPPEKSGHERAFPSQLSFTARKVLVL